MALFRRTLTAFVVFLLLAIDLSADDVPNEKNEAMIANQPEEAEVFVNRESFIESINETLVFDPDIITSIDGVSALDKDGNQKAFTLNGVPIEQLELEQLNELWNKMNIVMQGRHLEILQEVNRQQNQQRLLRDIQENQRTMQHIRNINVNNTPRPPQPPPRPPQMPPRTNR